MDDVIIWFIVTGALFIAMALAGSFVARVPLTPSVLYVGAGVLLGPYVSALLTVNPVEHAGVLERLGGSRSSSRSSPRVSSCEHL